MRICSISFCTQIYLVWLLVFLCSYHFLFFILKDLRKLFCVQDNCDISIKLVCFIILAYNNRWEEDYKICLILSKWEKGISLIINRNQVISFYRISFHVTAQVLYGSLILDFNIWRAAKKRKFEIDLNVLEI